MNSKRIAIVGVESSGKSVLAAQLARNFKEPWVPEYARPYLTRLNRDYVEMDLRRIAAGQLRGEEAAARRARRFVFCDTNLLVLRIWSEVYYGHTPAWWSDLWQARDYAFHLLPRPDLPWEPDPLRDYPDPSERWSLFERYRRLLKELALPFVEIRGLGDARLAAAVAACEALPG